MFSQALLKDMAHNLVHPAIWIPCYHKDISVHMFFMGFTYQSIQHRFPCGPDRCLFSWPAVRAAFVQSLPLGTQHLAFCKVHGTPAAPIIGFPSSTSCKGKLLLLEMDFLKIES